MWTKLYFGCLTNCNWCWHHSWDFYFSKCPRMGNCCRSEKFQGQRSSVWFHRQHLLTHAADNLVARELNVNSLFTAQGLHPPQSSQHEVTAAVSESWLCELHVLLQKWDQWLQGSLLGHCSPSSCILQGGFGVCPWSRRKFEKKVEGSRVGGKSTTKFWNKLVTTVGKARQNWIRVVQNRKGGVWSTEVKRKIMQKPIEV